MKNRRLVFDYIKKKYKKNLRKLIVLNFLLLALLISSAFTVMLSVGNINSNILNNEKLSMVLINGYSEDGEYNYNIERIERMPNVKDVVYEYDTTVLLEVDGKSDFISCLSLNPTTQEAINFYEKVEEPAIILPENFKGKTITFYDMDHTVLKVNEYYYEGNGHFFLKDYCYVTPDIHSNLTDKIDMEENFSGVKNLIVHLEKMEHIFDFVTTFHDMFDEEDVYVYYQAEGLEELISDSKTSLLLLIIFEIILFIVILIIYRGSLASFIKVLNRDLISLYLNGMSSKQIISQFYTTIEKSNRIIYFLSFIFVFIIGGLLSFKVIFPTLVKWMLIIIGTLIVLVMLNKVFVRYMIISLLKRELSSGNIVSKLRN
ncbi:hypothetical protein ACFFIS_03715 [Virgibacillus soli]|uniref:ABC transporter permease n=1 Tax=Paracerasibacillus soli TaxID=480284 RepID=A0ABU5CSN9_9BACI|nr:hypothetical protein [Virgibacillus soli]MDY0408852.1 hypothetical protein [Virgibacillus soli]